MFDVKAIENAVQALPPDDLAEFRRWFAEFDFAAWDQRIESDLTAGKLDSLLADAHEDLATGERQSL